MERPVGKSPTAVAYSAVCFAIEQSKTPFCSGTNGCFLAVNPSIKRSVGRYDGALVGGQRLFDSFASDAAFAEGRIEAGHIAWYRREPRQQLLFRQIHVALSGDRTHCDALEIAEVPIPAEFRYPGDVE